MKQLLQNKPLAIGLALLGLGQVLDFFGFTTLFVLALVYVLAIGLPYPRMLHSLTSRIVAAILLAFSVIQLMGVVQFFVLPSSDFRVLSLLSTLLTFGLVWGLRARLPKQKLVLWEKKDTAAAVAVLCFVLPFVFLCFAHNNPLKLTSFGGVQSPDGTNHYIAIAEMASTQHLDYRTVQYYPKGFHLASALVMEGLHANQRDLSWVMNARVFVGMYIAWGALLGYLIFYLSCQLLESFAEKRGKKLPMFLLAIGIGPVLSLLYLLPFAYDGFINYYYVSAAVMLGVLYLYEYAPLAKRADHWLVVAYLLLAFGVSMSWGPLLVPGILIAPLLYVLPEKQLSWATAKRFFTREYIWVDVAFLAQLLPLYLHFKYARLASAQGINALGIIRDFHFGILIVGLAVTLYLVFGAKVVQALRDFSANVLIPFYLLTVALMAVQYLSVGELRYYAIKTAFLLELMLLAVTAALLVYACMQSSLSAIQRWFLVPVVLAVGMFLVLGVNENPLLTVRQMFRTYTHFPKPQFYDSDTKFYTQLGLAHKLDGTNNEVLHYSAPDHKVFGNSLITNWVNVLQYRTDGDAATAKCSSTIFATLAYGTGAPEEQATLLPAIKTCIALAQAHHVPYYIVTDQDSATHLRPLFGNYVTYLY